MTMALRSAGVVLLAVIALQHQHAHADLQEGFLAAPALPNTLPVLTACALLGATTSLYRLPTAPPQEELQPTLAGEEMVTD